jgi:hypothetical protein
MSGPLRAAIGLILVATIAVASGCNWFDPRLYLQAPDGGGTGHDLGGVGGNGPSDAATLVVDAARPTDAARPGDIGAMGPLCGRPSPSSLCPGSYLFCDGFEDESGQMFTHWSSFLTDNLSGSPANAGTNLLVDGTAACLGQRALDGTTVGVNQEAVLIRTLGNLPNPVHVRFFLYIQQHTASTGLVELRSGAGDFASLFVFPPTASMATSRFALQTSFQTATPSIGPEITLAHNQWLCLELTLQLDTANGSVHVDLDGNPLGDVTGVQTEPVSSLMDRLVLGPISADDATMSATNELRFDEVAVAAGPIGCM